MTGVSNGEVGMATADTDDELMNELEQDDDSQRKLDEALEREALSSDRAALVRMDMHPSNTEVLMY